MAMTARMVRSMIVCGPVAPGCPRQRSCPKPRGGTGAKRRALCCASIAKNTSPASAHACTCVRTCQQKRHERMDVAQGSGYSWTQTKADLTLLVTLPAGSTARDVNASVQRGCVRVEISGAILVAGELHDDVTSSVWSVDGQTLNYELEKTRPAFWKCALRGDAEVDVQALIAREKRDQEPAYKPDPDAENQPKRVTDKEELRKLAAEFPQLATQLDLGSNPHTATHRNFAGPRKAFEWGALPADDGPTEANTSTSVPPVPLAAQPKADSSPAPAAPAAPASSAFQWGAIPSTMTTAQPPAPAPAAATNVPPPPASGPYSWGALPPDASSTTATAARVPELSPAAPAPPIPAASSVVPRPPASGPYSWGALPSDASSATATAARVAAPAPPPPDKYVWGAVPIA